MGLAVEWERREGQYRLSVESRGFGMVAVTDSLPLASKLTTMLLELEPQAFQPAEPIVPPDESTLPPQALADADADMGLKAGEAG
jgi:hypothetical protein